MFSAKENDRVHVLGILWHGWVSICTVYAFYFGRDLLRRDVL